jgi:hypothetical protein
LGLPDLDPPTVKYFTRVHTLQMGVYSKVFAGFNHSFALLDHTKVRRSKIEHIDEIPAPEFRCEKKLTSHKSMHTSSMKDLNDVEDLIPKDTIGWILQY